LLHIGRERLADLRGDDSLNVSPASSPRVLRASGGGGAAVMSLHKLSAGWGYTYLTRQVAADDVTARGRGSLGDYYAERGESPGVWLGAGLPSLDGGPQPGCSPTFTTVQTARNRSSEAEGVGFEPTMGVTP
jgi:hypothetical protein